MHKPPIEHPGQSEIELEIDKMHNRLADSEALRLDAEFLEVLCELGRVPAVWKPETVNRVFSIASLLRHLSAKAELQGTTNE